LGLTHPERSVGVKEEEGTEALDSSVVVGEGGGEGGVNRGPCLTGPTDVTLSNCWMRVAFPGTYVGPIVMPKMTASIIKRPRYIHATVPRASFPFFLCMVLDARARNYPSWFSSMTSQWREKKPFEEGL
jgi:hypothetical protein